MKSVYFFITYFAMIESTSIKSKNFWHTPEFLNSGIVQFITGGCFDSLDSEERFRHDIRHHNPYAPIIADLISYWDFSTSRYAWDNTYQNSHLRRDKINKGRSLSPNIQITFINLKCGKQNLPVVAQQLHPLYYRIALSHENPDYIFLQVYHSPSFAYPPADILTSTFLQFDCDLPNYLEILCVPCGLKIPGPNFEYSLRGISASWKRRHKNLNSRIIIVLEIGYLISAPGKTCGASLYFHTNFLNHHHCSVKEMAIMFNFTVSQFYKEVDRHKIIGEIRLSIVTDNSVVYGLISRRYKEEMLPNGIEFRNFKFAIVTKKPSAIVGFETLYAPFDSVTWELFLSTCVSLIAIMLLQSGIIGNYPIEMVESVWNKIYWIFATLVGQSAGIGLVLSRNTAVIFPWLTCWYFGCMLLSNFYQGEVYSSLTSVSMPYLPKTLQHLIDSELAIITYSSTYARRCNSTYFLSNLEYQLNLMLESIKFRTPPAKYLVKLMKRLHHVGGYGSFNRVQVVKNISNSYPLHDHQGTRIPTKGNIAFLDSEVHLPGFIDLVELFDKKSIVRNYDDVNVRITVFAGASRNYIFPLIHYAIGQFQQAGLSKHWEIMYHMHILRDLSGILLSTYNSRFYRKRRDNAKSDPQFNEAQPVSLSAIEYLVVGCGLLTFVACIAFMIEVRKAIVVLIQSVYQVMLLLVLKVRWRCCTYC